MKAPDSNESVAVGIGGKTMPGWWSARMRDQRGQELVEAAFVIPLLITLILGIVYLGWAYSIYATLNHAAREGARYAVSPKCATCGNVLPSDVWTKVEDPILSASGIHLGASDHPAPTCETLASSGSWVGCNLSAPPGQETRWSVTLSYPFSISIPMLPVIPINISTHVTVRGEERE